MGRHHQLQKGAEASCPKQTIDRCFFLVALQVGTLLMSPCAPGKNVWVEIRRCSNKLVFANENM